jgi:hypothetical protein
MAQKSDGLGIFGVPDGYLHTNQFFNDFIFYSRALWAPLLRGASDASFTYPSAWLYGSGRCLYWKLPSTIPDRSSQQDRYVDSGVSPVGSLFGTEMYDPYSDPPYSSGPYWNFRLRVLFRGWHTAGAPVDGAVKFKLRGSVDGTRTSSTDLGESISVLATDWDGTWRWLESSGSASAHTNEVAAFVRLQVDKGPAAGTAHMVVDHITVETLGPADATSPTGFEPSLVGGGSARTYYELSMAYHYRDSGVLGMPQSSGRWQTTPSGVAYRLRSGASVNPRVWELNHEGLTDTDAEKLLRLWRAHEGFGFGSAGYGTPVPLLLMPMSPWMDNKGAYYVRCDNDAFPIAQGPTGWESPAVGGNRWSSRALRLVEMV